MQPRKVLVHCCIKTVPMIFVLSCFYLFFFFFPEGNLLDFYIDI